MSKHPQSGFTLVEMLVAIFIFSVIATAGVSTLRTGITAQDQFLRVQERVQAENTLRMMLKTDLLQIVLRPRRDEFGNRFNAHFFGGDRHLPNPREGEKLLMSFVRHGWVNPQWREPRSNLQYVEYVFREGGLYRRVTPYVDGARGQPFYDRLILSDLQQAQMLFLRSVSNDQLDWIDSWPTGTNFGTPQVVMLRVVWRSGVTREYQFWVGALI